MAEMRRAALIVAACSALIASPAGASDVLTVGSKKFTESYVLGEIARMALEREGFAVAHRQGIGATGLLWEALRAGAIDAYPEYTGTISQEILRAEQPMDRDALVERLRDLGIGVTEGLGFNNTYALVMRRDHAHDLAISRIGDLARHPELRMSFSNEFLERADGWPALARAYRLQEFVPRGIEHGLAYRALASGRIDVTDAYSTDAAIAQEGFEVLEDDRQVFPQYLAVYLYRLELPNEAVGALESLAGTLDEERMMELNAEAERTSDYSLAGALYFGEGAHAAALASRDSYAAKLIRWTGQHLLLVGTSMALAIAVGLPLGIAASRAGSRATLILGTTGVVQTIPSLALLALFVPWLGIGQESAIVALFLYSLLPIVRNTATGLQDIAPGIRESAAALGLPPRARMMKVYLPMASRSILAGTKTSAVINVGTATIAALIGAGGLGEPIVSGLSLNDNGLILQGAIPAAILALLVQGGFDLLDRLFIPRGLRLR